jgi:hypothetical protein
MRRILSHTGTLPRYMAEIDFRWNTRKINL